MKHYGDITKLNGAELPIVDVITGGSPCQDLSVAGKREGLAGERSGLFMEQIRIVKEMRAHDRRTNGRSDVTCRPRYMVWENVPGAFSSNGGKDFQAVLTEIVRIAEPGAPDVPLFGGGGRKRWDKSGCLYDEMGCWSVAWRVHDAQFWGVPQRRKRIALVADFAGFTAPEVLFEREGLQWDFTEGGETGKTVTGGIGEGVAAAGKCLNTWDVQSKHIQPEDGVAETLYSGEKTYGGGMSHVMTEPKLMDAYQHHGYRESETCNPLTRDQNNNVRGDTPLVVSEEPIPINTMVSTRGGKDDMRTTFGVGQPGDPQYTLSSAHAHAIYEDKTISFQERAGKEGGGKGILIQNERVGALSTLNNQSVLTNDKTYCLQGNGIDRADTAGCNGKGWREDVSYTLNTLDRPAVYASHGQDARYNDLGEVCETVSATYGMGGGNAPIVLNDQGGEYMSVSQDKTGTIRSQMGGHVPVVMQ